MPVGFLERLDQQQRAGRTQVAGAIRASVPAVAIRLDDLARPGQIPGGLSVLFAEQSKAIARLNRRFKRVWVLTHVALISGHCIFFMAGLFIQLGRLPQNFAAELRVLATGRHRLEFSRRFQRLTAFEITDRQLCRYLGLQGVFRVAAAKCLQHTGGGVPILERDQGRRGIVLGGNAYRRGRGQYRDPQEMIGGIALAPSRARLLALFVDRGGQSLAQRAAVGRLLLGQGQHLLIGGLGTIIGA